MGRSRAQTSSFARILLPLFSQCNSAPSFLQIAKNLISSKTSTIAEYRRREDL